MSIYLSICMSYLYKQIHIYIYIYNTLSSAGKRSESGSTSLH